MEQFSIDKITQILKDYKEEKVIKGKDLPSAVKLKKHFQECYGFDRQGIKITSVKKYSDEIYLHIKIPKDLFFNQFASMEVRHINLKEMKMILTISSKWFEQILEDFE